jgi:4-hydroxy-2-oxoheptanedioate aldolase
MRGVSLATRANRYGRDADYGQNANDEVCLLVQLETPKALANLEQIAAVEGIDALFIGPADLAATLGHLGNARHPDVQGAIHNARARAHACGKPIGILMADPELSAQYIRDGFDYVAVATDISLLRAGAEAALKQARTHQRS